MLASNIARLLNDFRFGQSPLAVGEGAMIHRRRKAYLAETHAGSESGAFGDILGGDWTDDHERVGGIHGTRLVVLMPEKPTMTVLESIDHFHYHPATEHLPGLLRLRGW